MQLKLFPVGQSPRASTREQVESVGIGPPRSMIAWTVVSRWKALVIGTDPGAIDNEDCRAASWVYLGPFGTSLNFGGITFSFDDHLIEIVCDRGTALES